MFKCLRFCSNGCLLRWNDFILFCCRPFDVFIDVDRPNNLYFFWLYLPCISTYWQFQMSESYWRAHTRY